MQSAILPFGPVIRDFLRNLWYLRLFLILIVVSLLVSSGALAVVEGGNMEPGGTALSTWGHALGVTFNGALFGLAASYTPVTFIGRLLGVFNALISFILLGMLIWVIEQSLSDHRLKKSKYLIIPTREDF